MTWHIYFLPPGTVVSQSTGLPRDQWSTVQDTLYKEALQAAGAKGWNLIERGIAELLTITQPGGVQFAAFTTRKPDQTRIVMSKMPLNQFAQYLA